MPDSIAFMWSVGASRSAGSLHGTERHTTRWSRRTTSRAARRSGPVSVWKCQGARQGRASRPWCHRV